MIFCLGVDGSAQWLYCLVPMVRLTDGDFFALVLTARPNGYIARCQRFGQQVVIFCLGVDSSAQWLYCLLLSANGMIYWPRSVHGVTVMSMMEYLPNIRYNGHSVHDII